MADEQAGPAAPGHVCPNAARAEVECLDAVRQLWDCLDGELTAERLREVQAHLERCAGCYPHFDFGRRFLDALAATRPDCAAPEELRERIERALREAGFARS